MAGWGALLGGLAAGYGQYKQAQEDASYTRQSRDNQLQAQELSNQQQQLSLQQQQRAMADADMQHKAALAALSPDNSATDQTGQQPQSAGPGQDASAGYLSPSRPQNTGITPGSSLAGLKSSGMSPDDLAKLDKQNGLPIGTMYGLMSAESSGQPDAVSSKGAQGLFQVMPDTAANPGYGLKAFDPKDPAGAAQYFAAMYKKAGGDMTRALGYWNAGPNGNPNNSETKAFTPRVMKGAQEFQQQYGLQQQAQAPTPADKFNAQQDSGAHTPVASANQAVQMQQQQIQQYMKTAQYLVKQGRPDLAQPWMEQATKLQTQGVALQQKQVAMQKEANETVVKAASGVQDQDSYDGFLSQLKDNPAMQSTVKGLQLTGDFNQDRNKIATLANRAMTMKDQQDLDIKRQELALKQQQAQREQQKADAPLRAQAQAQAEDDKRAQQAAQKGIPFLPSPGAAGGDPVAIRQQQMLVAKNNNKVLTDVGQSAKAAEGISAITTQLGALLSKPNPVTTGGFTRIPGVGAAVTAAETDRQVFQKLSGQLVSQMQAETGSQGGSRSSFTAAMYKNYELQKPSLDYGRDANKVLVTGLWLGAQDTKARGKFLREFHETNPHSDLQDGSAMWESYEQSLGPAMIVDPSSPTGFHPNMNRAATLPDGKPNPSYQDYHEYFKKNYHAD